MARNRKKDDEIPSTIARSPAKARRTWKKAHDSAVETYGEGERAHRTAFAALKHAFARQGDRWVPKARKGPSDPRARTPAHQARQGKGETFGGVDYYGSTKDELARRARNLGVRGTSRMTKRELARAVGRRQRGGCRRAA